MCTLTTQGADIVGQLGLALGGALIALFLKVVYDEFRERQDREHFRKALEDNITVVLIPKLRRLIGDYETVRKVILSPNRAALEAQRIEIDGMPMFNSDLLKRLPPQDVYRCLTDKKKYSLLLESHYSIDWLRDSMPQKILAAFHSRNLEHFEKTADHEKEDYMDHLFNCTYAEAVRRNLNSEISARLATAQELMKELEQLQQL